jgi:hypothetical protein
MARLRALLPLAALLAAGALHVAPAAASPTQLSIFQDDSQIKTNWTGTLSTLKSLGVTTVRVGLTWDSVAPPATRTGGKPSFNASDAASRLYNFYVYDQIVQTARQDGITVDFLLTGPAPAWADGRGEPRGGPAGVWKPSASEFGAFVHAVGERYSGHFTPAGASGPLPAVRFWSIWNEPNYGPNLAPQTIDHDTIEVGAAEYRSLLGAAWNGLMSSGHSTRTDTILIGETAPRGVDHPIGNFGGVKPLRFLRALYCVGSNNRPLSGRAAALRGCPTTAAARRRFRSQNPALFSASGFAAHLYASQSNPGPPTQPTNEPGRRGEDPDYADLPAVGRLERTLDALNRTWGSGTHYRIYNTEYGYRTRPPDPHAGVSQAAAALFINWGEYISFRNPRIASYSQYLLVDPRGGVFASGLELPNGRPKATYAAYRMPLFLPSGSTRHGRKLEVWGGVRPAPDAGRGQRALIQFQRGGRGGWSTVTTVTITNVRGYFDVRETFPASGNVRIAWTSPSGVTEYSRTAAVSIH